jgi:hypothetical protein
MKSCTKLGCLLTLLVLGSRSPIRILITGPFTPGTGQPGRWCGGTGHDPVTVSDSPTVDLTLTGQALSAAVKLSADAGNQAEARADGVYVPAPPAGHDAVTVSDSPTVDLTLTGQALAAAVKLSADAGNQAEARPDGVYVFLRPLIRTMR